MEFISSFKLFGVPLYLILAIYSLPGLVYAGFQLCKQYKEHPSEFARNLISALVKEKRLSERLLNLIVYIIAVICIAIGWPLFAIWAVYESKKEAAYKIENNNPDFTCSSEHLISKVNPVDAEIASYVIDPLGTVPPLPFGHLNKGWVNFLSDMTVDRDEMWSFNIPKGSKYGKYRIAATSEIKGYARVSNGKVLAEFITESD